MIKLFFKLFLWIHRRHKWHKDWLGCPICKLRLRNNPDKPVNNIFNLTEFRKTVKYEKVFRK